MAGFKHIITFIVTSFFSAVSADFRLSKYFDFFSNPYYEKNTCNVLAFTGGGSYGAIQVGILDSLIYGKNIPNQFDIITGISAGGLNAAFLSYYPTLSLALPDLKQIILNITTKEIYKQDYFKLFSKWSIYDNTPLEYTLRNIFTNKFYHKTTTKTLIGATNLITEELDVYEYSLLDYENKINLLMSTTAIPFIFPPRKMNNQLYIDGGVINNEMIFQALGVMRCQNYSIIVISASPKTKQNKNIDGLLSYIGSVAKLILNTFDNQVSDIISVKCEYPIGTLKLCYPLYSNTLNRISILDFDKGDILYEIGKNNFTCENHLIC